MTDIEIPEGFTRWDGKGACPVRPGRRVEYIMRGHGTSVYTAKAGYLSWAHPAFNDGDSDDIIAYRVLT